MTFAIVEMVLGALALIGSWLWAANEIEKIPVKERKKEDER